jgi:phosphoglycerol transferase
MPSIMPFTTNHFIESRRNMKFQRFLIICILFIVLFACSKSEEKANQSSQGQKAVNAIAEGIDFTKKAYPEFITEVTGMSGWEPWGRWTEGEKAAFRFDKPLPAKFTLIIKADAFGPNMNSPIRITVGTVQEELVIKESGKTYRLPFDLKEQSDTVTIFVPHPISPLELKLPDNNDARKIGVGLIYLKIEA